MGIRKRGDKWLVTVELGRDNLAVRRRAYFTADSEDEAKRVFTSEQSKAYEGRHIKPSREPVPVYCRRYLEGRERISPATRARYELFLKHVERDLAKLTLATFTPKAAATWKKNQLATDGLSPVTVRKHLVFVKAAMERAVRAGLIGANPLEHVELPADTPPPFHVYSAAEQAAILSAAAPAAGDREGRHVGRSDGALRVPLVLALATGMRRGELLGLRVTDVDVARSRIHVRQAMSRTGIGPTKTQRSRRTIVLPQSVADMLAAYIGGRPRVRSDLLVLSLRGQPYRPDGFESCWQKVRERAAAIMVRDAEAMHDPYAAEVGDGLRGARFHDLRHTHATELLRAGVHVKVVAERLGDTEATVLRTYSHVLPDMQEAAAEALEPMMRGLIIQVR